MGHMPRVDGHTLHLPARSNVPSVATGENSECRWRGSCTKRSAPWCFGLSDICQWASDPMHLASLSARQDGYWNSCGARPFRTEGPWQSYVQWRRRGRLEPE